LGGAGRTVEASGVTLSPAGSPGEDRTQSRNGSPRQCRSVTALGSVGGRACRRVVRRSRRPRPLRDRDPAEVSKAIAVGWVCLRFVGVGCSPRGYGDAEGAAAERIPRARTRKSHHAVATRPGCTRVACRGAENASQRCRSDQRCARRTRLRMTAPLEGWVSGPRGVCARFAISFVHDTGWPGAASIRAILRRLDGRAGDSWGCDFGDVNFATPAGDTLPLNNRRLRSGENRCRGAVLGARIRAVEVGHRLLRTVCRTLRE